MKYDSTFTGTGSDRQIKFIETMMQIADGLNGLKVYMGPVNGGGWPVDVTREKGGIVIDMSKLIFSGGGGLPSMAGKTNSMVLQITDQTTETADWDWVKAGPAS